ncbi:NTF2- export protein 2, partial [Borealophlyctis nickersoniae]
MLNQLYKDSSAVIWNGNAMSGVGPFSEFYLKLPVTEHQVVSYDGQPLVAPGTDPHRCQILLTVTGIVKYGDEKDGKAFVQVFILCPDSDPSRKGT